MLKTLYARLVLWLIRPALRERGLEEHRASRAPEDGYQIQFQATPKPYVANLALLKER